MKIKSEKSKAKSSTKEKGINADIIDKKMFIMEIDKKNRMQRIYPMQLITKWINSEQMKNKNNGGFDVEFSLFDENNIEDNAYISLELNCGIVYKLEIENNKLYGWLKLKRNDLTKDIYNGKISIDDLCLIPKGNGSFREYTLDHNDYDLLGFNLVRKEESSFIFENDKSKTEKEMATSLV